MVWEDSPEQFWVCPTHKTQEIFAKPCNVVPEGSTFETIA